MEITYGDLLENIPYREPLSDEELKKETKKWYLNICKRLLCFPIYPIYALVQTFDRIDDENISIYSPKYREEVLKLKRRRYIYQIKNYRSTREEMGYPVKLHWGYSMCLLPRKNLSGIFLKKEYKGIIWLEIGGKLITILWDYPKYCPDNLLNNFKVLLPEVACYHEFCLIDQHRILRIDDLDFEYSQEVFDKDNYKFPYTDYYGNQKTLVYYEGMCG